MQKITPFLWFDNQAEEAANFYVSVFKNSQLGTISRYPEGGPAPAGQAIVAMFTLDGIEFAALNGGPQYTFNEAVSFVIDCADQAEVDYYWDKLTADGGEESQCGWLKDKYGVSWQIVPSAMDELMSQNDPAKMARVTQAFLKMKKFDLAELEKAAAGE